jgi:hypothetical protein
MKELIKRPGPVIDRPAVELSLHRLMRDPSEIKLDRAMRAVDEYAATLHTSRVHAHAERVVAQALIDAAGAKQDDKNFVITIRVADAENFFYEFLPENFNFYNFFKEGRDPGAVRTYAHEKGRTQTFCVRPDGVRTIEAENGHCEPAAVPSLPSDCSKSCTRCGLAQPPSAYSRNKSRPDGLASACRTCDARRKREARAARAACSETPGQ